MKVLWRLTAAVFVLGVLLCSVRQAQAQAIGQIISYQGKLTNADGTPVANGVHSVTFAITGNGQQVFSQTSSVATLGGVFSVFLGVGALTFDPSQNYVMRVTANGVTTTHSIASVPMAQVAKDNVKKSGDTMTGELTMAGTDIAGVSRLNMGGASITNTRAIYGPANEQFDILTPTDAPFNIQSHRTGRVNIGLQGHQDLWLSGNIVSNSVGTAAIQDGAVTQSKAPWAISGTSNNMKVARGRTLIPRGAWTTISFGTTFTSPPIVVATATDGGKGSVVVQIHPWDTTTTSFKAGLNGEWDIDINWIAIGN